VGASFFVGARSMTGRLGWVLVRCGEATVVIYLNNGVEDCVRFHSAAVVDLIVIFRFIIDVESFNCIHHCFFRCDV
jgi:hypothetical protein